ncbi:RNA-directed DNA polymerase, eukaryota, partial [Tanacetum coccineum]
MTRWVKCVPIKVNILAWKIRSDALPTRINISRRGIDIQSISCPICDHGAETSDHLFFKCNMVREIGRKIARWWNINFEEVNSYEEWKTWIVSCRMDTKLKHMFEGIWYSLWWYVWNYRNKLLFDDKIPMKAVIFDNVISSSFYWSIFGNKGALDTCKRMSRRSPWIDAIHAIHSLQSKGEVALKVLFKRLYALEMCKSISVAEKMGHSSLVHSFRRMPGGGVEQEHYDSLCLKVADLVLPNVSDRWSWSLEGS